MADQACGHCQHWRKGQRSGGLLAEPSHERTWVETAPGGICCIRSTPGPFPIRYQDDWCHEYKRIENKHPGYLQTRAGIAE